MFSCALLFREQSGNHLSLVPELQGR